MKIRYCLLRKTRFRLLLTGSLLSLVFLTATLHSFAQYTKMMDFGSTGRHPNGSLISVGTYLYGMTSGGGSNDLGTIFKIKPDGTGFTKLLDFDGYYSGSYPYGSLYSDGTFLYGLTSSGGITNQGTIFKIKPDGTGYIKLHDFEGQFGGNPYGDLISDGTFLYGMTYGGGEFNFGTIFKISPDGSNFNLLLEFPGSPGGYYPHGSLTLAGSFLYGMTSSGGANGFGTIFKIKPDGSGFTNFFDFDGNTTGSYPNGSLLSDGTALYGMTYSGGTFGDGVIFKIESEVTFTNLHNLQGSADGSNPYGSLISDGTFLYGMASYYGNDYGTIFKIKPDGTSFTNLRSLSGITDGDAPYGSLLYDGTFLYGMTESGGSQSNHGTIFKITPDGTTYTKLFVFEDTGYNPYGSLISDGTFLYGMTTFGGAYNAGTIFKVKPDGSNYSTLHDFYFDGSNPYGSLLFDGAFLYGMTQEGGSNYGGTIFKILPDGTGYTKILDFDGSNGYKPYGSLISDGTFLYGMTSQGGYDGGLIFKIKPDGTGYVSLSVFDEPEAGYEPLGDLLLEGNVLYGMTKQGGNNSVGTIFKLNTDGTNFTTLYDFSASGDGGYPNGSLISDGTFLYGMTQSGGLGGGTVFKIKPDGTSYLKLHNLVGLDNFDGSSPYGSLTFDGTYLYGLTSTGGPVDLGTMFKMLPDGTDYTKLINFDGSLNGSNPRGSLLLLGSSLYGMTTYGGVSNAGVLFKYSLGSTNNLPPVIETSTISVQVQGTASINLLSLLSDPDDNIDLASLKIITQPESGALASIDGNHNLVLDYTGINFTGTDYLTIEICDLSLACTQQQLEIEVVGEIEIFNAVSPNNDGKNDILTIQYIDVLPDAKNNKVTIFDRWGSVVWEGTNYDNTSVVFNGTHENGKDLPTGTYFYKIDFNGGLGSKTGYISLKR